MSTSSFLAKSARNEGAQNLLRLNSYVGMIMDATERRETTARHTRSNASHGGSAAGVIATP